jgi:hypothetical protein
MSVTEGLAFIYVCSEADTRTGVWKGSAKSLSGELGISERTARDVLEKMEHGDYVRRFAVPGSHGCYPILVHKFLITSGEHNGEQVNAIDSKSHMDLTYFSREHGVEESVKDGVEHGAAQKRIENREKKREKKNPAAKPTPPADPRHQAVFESCFEAYKVRFGVAPTWGGREGKTLQHFLQEHPSIPAEEITFRYGHLLASTDSYHAEKHGSLVHLLSSFDVFADGPVVSKFSLKEGGLNRAEERDRNNLKAARLLQ